MKRILIVICLLGTGFSVFAGPAVRGAAHSPDGLSRILPSTGTIPGAPSLPPAGTPAIRQPREGARLPRLRQTFVFGAADPRGSLTINGEPVEIHPDGGFLTMVSLSSGTFAITAELALGATAYAARRTVFVAGPEQPSPKEPLAIEWISPDVDIEALPGEEVEVSCKGSPGMSAWFTVGKSKERYFLRETVEYPGGIYRGLFVIPAAGELKNARITVTLSDEKEHKKISRPGEHAVSRFSDTAPVMAEVVSPNAVLRAGPVTGGDDKAGYVIFPPVGTRLRVTGRRGDELRVRLSPGRALWTGSNDVRLLPEGTLSSKAAAGSVTVEGNDRVSRVSLTLGRRVPFDIVPDVSGAYVDITLYGVVSNTDWISLPAAGAIDQVRWFQDDEETYRLRVYTRNIWWGYDARYEGSAFIFELRCPPPPGGNHSPLSGITVVLDPGHYPDTGAVGPTGLEEKDANLASGFALRKKLEGKGARVVMTRRGNEAVALHDRPRIAGRAEGDILISLHNNAVGVSEDPLKKNGYGVYYFQPLSLPLARDIHTAYGEAFGPGNRNGMALRDDGIHYGNLVLVRTTYMPSVLIESAYIIVPREEALLKRFSFHDACADAVVRGLEKYLSRLRQAAAGPLPARRKK